MRYISQVVAQGGERRVVCSVDCRKALLEAQKVVAASELQTLSTFTMAVLNQKGGTGKTTTSVSLAAGLAARGFRTLLVDLDAQGNVAVSLGLRAKKSLYHVLIDGVRPQDAAVQVDSHLDVLIADQTLADAELELVHAPKQAFVLRQRMLPVVSPQSPYAFVILDCGPSLSLLNQNALTFARSVLVPVSCDYLSLVGVRLIVQNVEHVQRTLLTPVEIIGVLPTLFDRRNKIAKESIRVLEDRFEGKVLSPIRVDVRLKEAPRYKMPIFEYAPDSNGAMDYWALVDAMVAKRACWLEPAGTWLASKVREPAVSQP
ncbi:MAG: ParA family protein [Myxococcales bacterium]|nr:ParA family protein [Myxococcales bacterium]